MTDFPSTKFQRGKIFAQTGFLVGKNYASHYLKVITNGGGNPSDFHRKTAEDMFGQLTKLRGTALKIAQSFSIDQGLLPEEFSEVMARSQYSVPPINKSLVRTIIKRELGQYPEQLFQSFNMDAIAAASIGQVHKATLKTGEKVAVKIQYPGVRDTITSDIALARALLGQFVSKKTSLDPYIEEIKQTLLIETDYEQEGKAIERFNEKFSSEAILTPTWFPDYSTQRILTMSFIEGLHIDQFLAKSPSQELKDRYGQLLWDFFHRQIGLRGEIHADTHPGNFLLVEGGKLGVIDFGCVKQFPADFFMDYLNLLPTHLNHNDQEIKQLYRKLGILKDDPDSNKKEREIFEFCKHYGFTFAMPYLEDQFNFGDTGYRDLIRGYTKNTPFTNEPRGNKHFIYTTRVHLGLYHLLMKLGSQIDVSNSKEILRKVLLQN